GIDTRLVTQRIELVKQVLATLPVTPVKSIWYK
ncbi:MAG: hypothetical protein QOJ55_192, partial [Solirubrobacteraceae bacterium]|nr:hypothetical protein [Solirubrobacteraceae bacterium]